MTPRETPEVDETGPQIDPPGRLRGSWQVLRGQALVPDQIRAEWLEYQITFQSILRQFGALLARQAKAEKKKVDAQLKNIDSPPSVPVAAPVGNRKAEVRQKALALRGGVAAMRAPISGFRPNGETSE